MRLGIIKAYMLKEFIELIRTKLIVMVYLMPSMILILFGYGIKMDVTHVRTVIIDNDQSKLSQLLTAKFEHSKYFDTTVSYMSEKEALHLIKKAKIDAIVIIPSSFQRHLLQGQKSEIGIFIDAAFPTRGSTIESYIQGIILDTAYETAKKVGIEPEGVISVNYRTLFNQAMRDEDAIVPGLIGLVLLVAPAILAALLIVKEKEKGTIFNFYASPLSRGEFLIAKAMPVFLLHSINVFILFFISVYLFKVPFRGSFALYWFTSEIYILISLSIGMLVSIITNRQIVAVVLTVIITIIPGFLYSGILMPISSMEGESFFVAHTFPVMYFNHIIYDTFLIGQGLASKKLLLYILILIFYLSTLITLGTTLLKKELK
ncbi:ABC transporter permease [Hydrogenimonas thermophila]|uniref:ABC-type multidrug transport system, permease component n=1 Tax=Hydrogenimonas thermophila TaxID=223786 RepID=A0A1I5SAW7_9BACT|nr:ABC transporter permease [Hydrogenimonas thermophila]SFP67853.1 ABC-type multidrug transport system, permease component [Hydrogenimonas thermophila]